MSQRRDLPVACGVSFAVGIVSTLLTGYILQRRKKREALRDEQVPTSHAALTAALAGCGALATLSKMRRPSASIEPFTAGVETASPRQVHISRTKLDYLDRFLKMDCGPTLLEMGLFPNAKEITESMACLEAMDKSLGLVFSQTDTVCLVVGDGMTPRTAALTAVRTKWRRVVSVDPALQGLPLKGCESKVSGCEPRSHSHLANAPESRAKGRMRKRLARIAEVDRLELAAVPVADFSLKVTPNHDRCIVLVLPHAHVVPDIALGALCLEEAAVDLGEVPRIAVVQLPCCSFEKHNQICGKPPDLEYVDDFICSDKRTVRIWKDIAPAALVAQALHVGSRPVLTQRYLSQRVRSAAARESASRSGLELQPPALPK